MAELFFKKKLFYNLNNKLFDKWLNYLTSKEFYLILCMNIIEFKQ